jgi:hypothetical protein
MVPTRVLCPGIFVRGTPKPRGLIMSEKIYQALVQELEYECDQQTGEREPASGLVRHA